jgi:hypothetical protein
MVRREVGETGRGTSRRGWLHPWCGAGCAARSDSRHFLVDTDGHPVSNRGFRGPAVPGHRVIVSSGNGAAAWCCGRERVRIAERTGEKR